MCFSAQASFVAAITLTAIGIASIRQANDKTRLLACMPLVFAIQQLAEGVIWLGPNSHSSIPYAKNIFLIIAFFVWPLYIPIALFWIEKESRSKVLIGLCWPIGLFSVLGSAITLSKGSSVSIQDSHIYYNLTALMGSSSYLIATIAPFLLSTERPLNLLGLAAVLSCIATYFIWYHYFVSVWCFFAALLSLSLYAAIKRIE